MKHEKSKDSSQLTRVWSLIIILANKDLRTAEHSIGVACMTETFINYIDTELKKESCFIAGLLHDMGKISFSDYFFQNVIIKNEDDWAVIKEHPVQTKIVLENFGIDPNIIHAAHEHHERYNGSGYPQGLKGEEITILGRILGIVDSYSAITEDRSYRAGADLKQAVTILIKSKEEYDKNLLTTFIQNLNPIITLSKQKEKKYKKELYKRLNIKQVQCMKT